MKKVNRNDKRTYHKFPELVLKEYQIPRGDGEGRGLCSYFYSLVLFCFVLAFCKRGHFIWLCEHQNHAPGCCDVRAWACACLRLPFQCRLLSLASQTENGVFFLVNWLWPLVSSLRRFTYLLRARRPLSYFMLSFEEKKEKNGPPVCIYISSSSASIFNHYFLSVGPDPRLSDHRHTRIACCFVCLNILRCRWLELLMILLPLPPPSSPLCLQISIISAIIARRSTAFAIPLPIRPGHL